MKLWNALLLALLGPRYYNLPNWVTGNKPAPDKDDAEK